jgi:hypothetical protein
MIILDDFVNSLEPEIKAGGRHGLSRYHFDRLVRLYEEAEELLSLMDDSPDEMDRDAEVDRLHETLDALERGEPSP